MLKRFTKNNWLVPFLISTAVLVFIYRSVVANINTHLPDMFDFPYYAWVLDHFIQFVSGTHPSLFTTNIFYGFENSYFFSDLLVPQALLGLIPHLLGANPILVTNIIILGTFVLNILAAIYLWKNKIKNIWSLSFLTLVTALSPFVLLQKGHLQMMTVWPFLIVLALLVNKQKTYKSAILIGVFWAIQLLASAYLAIFAIVSIGLMALLELVIKPNKQKVILFYILLGLVAGILGGPIFLKYKLVQSSYGVTINYGEYITYNAHLSDYLFLPYKSLGHVVTAKWQQFNQHKVGESAIYPGLSLLGLTLVGLFGYKLQKKKVIFSLPLSIDHIFFLGLLFVGFIFSLGPRLFINGAYTQLPLPYTVPLKLIPFFTAIRATARWSWLVFLGLTYFSLVGLTKFKKEKVLSAVSIAAIVIFIIEMIPITSASVDMSKALDSNSVVIQNCQQTKQSLLIYPITQQHETADMFTNLARKTEFLLQSTQHNCALVNGYGGFEPPEYKELEQNLNTAIATNELTTFFELSRQKNINMILLESEFLPEESKTNIAQFLEESKITIVKQEENKWYLIELTK